MLSVRNLRKAFATVQALEDVSFSVQRGEVFGLLGPNGAGKTTSIRIVLNILLQDAGEILYDGKPFSDAVRSTLGYLPEERGLYKKSRLIDTIVYFGELRGMSRAKAKAEGLRWLQRLGLGDHAGRKCEELSKGNQQKIQFVSAILHDPALVILDEPFSGLDPVNQELFRKIFLELKDAGKAIIYSTHQMEQAEKLSDTICLINRGRVVLDGSVRDVKKRYGSDTLAVEFNGDGVVLEGLDGVKKVVRYGNSAELLLGPGANLQSLIAQLNSRIELRKVELREPSLQSIFIEAVGGAPVLEVAK
jgi:ABC-2 type transport system ATP-binding protein